MTNHKMTQKELREWSKHYANCHAQGVCQICGGKEGYLPNIALCSEHLFEFNKELADPNGKSIWDMWWDYTHTQLRKEKKII